MRFGRARLHSRRGKGIIMKKASRWGLALPFLGSTTIGQWRPTPSLLPGPPPSLAPGLTPWVAIVRPFTMQSDSQFRVDPPPDLMSQLWADNYSETKALGSLTSATRTAEQTEIGYFWADSGPVLWQNALRYISQNYVNDTGDSARMYALAEAAMADAQIACWTASTFTTSGARSRQSAWGTSTAIRQQQSILSGSRSLTRPTFPSTRRLD